MVPTMVPTVVPTVVEKGKSLQQSKTEQPLTPSETCVVCIRAAARLQVG
jgi:hypothetical protein